MGGRAGRRGIDTLGTVILLPNTSRLPSQSQMYNLICGSSQSVKSKFNPEAIPLLLFSISEVKLSLLSLDKSVFKSSNAT